MRPQVAQQGRQLPLLQPTALQRGRSCTRRPLNQRIFAIAVPHKARGDSTQAKAAVLEAPSLAVGLPRVQPEAESGKAEETFDWSQQWYPLFFLDDLSTTRPTPVQLLGKDLVIWRTPDGAWSALEDLCPHRLAPLSEGRVEDGTLHCSYHGWRFDAAGRCTHIPQVRGKAAETAFSNQRACVASFPTQVAQGLLWVWGDSSPAAHIHAAAKAPHTAPWMDMQDPLRTSDGKTLVPLGSPFMRDVPYSWNTMVDNLHDPAHVHYAHHGLFGNKHDPNQSNIVVSAARPEEALQKTLPSATDGFTYRFKMVMAEGRPYADVVSTLAFPGPFMLVTPQPTDFKGSDFDALLIYAVPLAPGRTRVLVQNFLVDPGFWRLPLAMRAALAVLPKWVDHMVGNAVMDGDGVLLFGQERAERAIEGATGERWNKTFYMPSPADRPVVDYRQWLDTRGGGGPFGPLKDLPPQPSKEQLLDRKTFHTDLCPSCSGALRNLRALRIAGLFAAGVTAAAALASAVFTRAAGVPAGAAPLWLVAACAVCAAAAAAAHVVIPRLVHHPWDHALRA